MKRIVILQKYCTPYRVPLFNAVAQQPGVDLTLLYYGQKEMRRKWTYFPECAFNEVQSRCISVRAGYERNLELPFSLIKDLGRIRPDMIICAPDVGGIAAYFYKRQTSKSYTIWSEATPVTEKKTSVLREKFRRAIYGDAESFIVPGILAEAYIRLYRQDVPVHVVPNSIEEQHFSLTNDELSAKFDRERLIITFSGSLIERKGIKLLLESYSRLMREKPELDDQCLLRILGTGPMDLTCYKRRNIEFAGFCEQQKYYEHIRSSHIFVLPSLSDNNPLTVVEALFAGNVILLADGVGNHPEAVRGNGAVVPSGSVEEMTRALERLLTTPRAELAHMAYNSLKIAREFSLKRAAAGFYKAIWKENPSCSV